MRNNILSQLETSPGRFRRSYSSKSFKLNIFVQDGINLK